MLLEEKEENKFAAWGQVCATIYNRRVSNISGKFGWLEQKFPKAQICCETVSRNNRWTRIILVN